METASKCLDFHISSVRGEHSHLYATIRVLKEKEMLESAGLLLHRHGRPDIVPIAHAEEDSSRKSVSPF